MIKIAVCDDNSIISKSIKKVLLNHDFGIKVDIDIFETGKDLYESSIKRRYEIILLDIELSENKKDDNGLIISNKIKNIYPEVVIIFFTGFPVYASSLLNFEPFRYINKPINYNELIRDVEAAIKRVKGWEDKNIIFKSNGIFYNIKINDIIYIMSQSPYILVNSLSYEDFKIRGKINDIQKEIEKISDNFCRPNQSFLVNKDFIKSFSSKYLELNNGEQINISRKYAKMFFDTFK